jgi:hypothetical protein
LENIFKDPKRLAQLLASIKVSYSEGRPLSPIEVARELKSVCENELGGDKAEAQRRFDLSSSMWSGFERILTLAPEIQDMIIWGASDENLGLGFTVAHFMAKFKPEDQSAIIDASWEHDRPIGKEELKEMHRYLRENPEMKIDDCIESVLQIRRASSTKEITHHFLSGLETEIFEKLKSTAAKDNIPINQLAKNIFSRKFKEDSVFGVSPRSDWIRITFSEKGRRELSRIMKETGVTKEEIVNHIFNQEEF